MGLYDTILLPTDGSPGFDRVTDHAVQLARVHGATLHALYVVDATNFTGLPMESSWEGIRGALEEEGTSALAGVSEQVGSEVDLETTTVEGTPSREIVRFATEHDVDCIVMGTHGRGGIDRLLLGSVAERVVRAAPVPVVTVNLGEDAAGERPANAEQTPQGRP